MKNNRQSDDIDRASDGRETSTLPFVMMIVPYVYVHCVHSSEDTKFTHIIIYRYRCYNLETSHIFVHFFIGIYITMTHNGMSILCLCVFFLLYNVARNRKWQQNEFYSNSLSFIWMRTRAENNNWNKSPLWKCMFFVRAEFIIRCLLRAQPRPALTATLTLDHIANAFQLRYL